MEPVDTPSNSETWKSVMQTEIGDHLPPWWTQHISKGTTFTLKANGIYFQFVLQFWHVAGKCLQTRLQLPNYRPLCQSASEQSNSSEAFAAVQYTSITSNFQQQVEEYFLLMTYSCKGQPTNGCNEVAK